MPLRGPARPLDLVRALGSKGSSVTEHERRDAGTVGLGGFDAGSAASDVLAGIDLTGSTAVVTGGTPAPAGDHAGAHGGRGRGGRGGAPARYRPRGGARMDRVEVFDLDP